MRGGKVVLLRPTQSEVEHSPAALLGSVNTGTVHHLPCYLSSTSRILTYQLKKS